MAVELRMTAITDVLELRSGLNPSGQLVVGLYKVVIKAIIEFSCVNFFLSFFLFFKYLYIYDILTDRHTKTINSKQS